MNLVGTRTAEDTFFTLVVDSLHLGRFLREAWNTALHLVAGIWAREPGFPDFLCV